MQRMAGVRVKENEPIESAIRRFKKQCEKAGILAELRKREHYEKPSVRRKKKAMAARKRALRRAARVARALFLVTFNRAAGAVFGLAKGAALLGFALLLAQRLVPSAALAEVIAASRLGRPLTDLATGVVSVGRTLSPSSPARPGAANRRA